MEHLSSDQEDHPNQHENRHKLCDETGHPILSLLECQWELRQQRDHKFSSGGKAIVEQILGSEEINKSKRAEM